jgi:hypothetical protein
VAGDTQSVMRAIGTLILTTFVGLLLGFFVFWLTREGYHIKWKPIPPPPEPATELIVSREFYLYINTQSNQTYRWGSGEWVEANVPDDIYEGVDEGRWIIQKPCDIGWPVFSPFASPPSRVMECIQDEAGPHSFYNKHVFALDREGNLWVWHYLVSGLGLLGVLIYWILIGSFVGFGFGTILLVIRHFRNKSAARS